MYVCVFVCGQLVSTNIGVGPLHSPSLPLDNLVGETEECVFLIVECLRAIIEGVQMHCVYIIVGLCLCCVG